MLGKSPRRCGQGAGGAVERLDILIRKTVESYGEIMEEFARITTAPGVGFLSAACIHTELGLLRNYTRR